MAIAALHRVLMFCRKGSWWMCTDNSTRIILATSSDACCFCWCLFEEECEGTLSANEHDILLAATCPTYQCWRQPQFQHNTRPPSSIREWNQQQPVEHTRPNGLMTTRGRSFPLCWKVRSIVSAYLQLLCAQQRR